MQAGWERRGTEFEGGRLFTSMGGIAQLSLIFTISLLFITLCSSSPPLSQSQSAEGTDDAASRNMKEEVGLPEVHCSRERSRAAWKAIEEYLMPFMEKEKYQLPSKCRLHRSNDIFREQEEHKVHVDINEWQCGYCKKSFRAEKYLDQHFDNRHLNLLNVSHNKCLADLCGALHCDLVMNPNSRKTKCNPAAAVKNHHLCEDLANSCFPVTEGPSATRLHEIFLRQFCDAHPCSSGKKPFTRGSRKRTNILYMATAILILIFLPVFYLIVYLHQREKRTGTTQLKRFANVGKKPKPS